MKKTLGFVPLLIGIVTIPLVVMVGADFYYEYQASVAVKGLKAWTKEDCAQVWNEAKILSTKHGDGTVVEGNELPEPLRRAGFKSARVSPSEFRARHGGSSFGTPGGFAHCYFNGYHDFGPMMIYSGGLYYPDGRWEPRR